MKIKLHMPGFIRNDFLRKLVAFFFAVLIWKAVDVQLHEFETFSDVPVRINYEAGKVVVETESITVNVTVRGSRRRLQKLRVEDISIQADVPVIAEGVRNYELRITDDDVNTPPGVRVQTISPARIQIPVDRIISRELPVKVVEQGKIAKGYRIEKRDVVPSKVTVIGASKLVNEIAWLNTKTIVLRENIASDFNQDNVQLDVPTNLRVSPRMVHVAYSIAQHTTQKNVTGILVKLLHTNKGRLEIKNTPNNVSVTVRGTTQDLEKVNSTTLQAFVDISSIADPGTYELPVNVWPDNPAVSIEYVNPETIEIMAAQPVTETKSKPEQK